ncbi:MAG: hypothetical protein ACM31D_19585 [Bacteroidota bacterium]
MPKRTPHQSKPEGRRIPAPSRRLPPPANDNLTPGRRRMLQAALTTVLAVATVASLYYLLLA